MHSFKIHIFHFWGWILIRSLFLFFPADNFSNKIIRYILPISGLTRVEIFLRRLYGIHNFVMSGLICICIFYGSHHQKLILLRKQFSLTTGTAHLVKSHRCALREPRPLILKNSSLLLVLASQQTIWRVNILCCHILMGPKTQSSCHKPGMLPDGPK